MNQPSSMQLLDNGQSGSVLTGHCFSFLDVDAAAAAHPEAEVRREKLKDASYLMIAVSP